MLRIENSGLAVSCGPDRRPTELQWETTIITLKENG